VDTENGCTIDLHGASVSEAIQIVRTILVESPATNAQPLKIITGRGLHSASGVGVLGPAIKNALIEDGWNVDKWSAGLIVRGRLLRR
jgi:DNA-nicking Smr family endonuclease